MPLFTSDDKINYSGIKTLFQFLRQQELRAVFLTKQFNEPPKEIKNMSDIPIPERDIGEVIMTAINEVGRSEGASLDDIERYLVSTLNDVPDLERIQSILNSAVANGSLLKLDNGKYKINGALEGAEAASENVNCDEKVPSKSHRGDLNKAKGLPDMITKCGKEDVQEVKRAFVKVDRDENQNADPDVENVDSSVTEKEDANVPFPHDDDKNKATERAADYCTKKDVQREVKSALKVAQDATKKEDCNARNVYSSAAEQKDSNIPLPDDDDIKNTEKMMRDLMKDK